MKGKKCCNKIMEAKGLYKSWLTGCGDGGYAVLFQCTKCGETIIIDNIYESEKEEIV